MPELNKTHAPTWTSVDQAAIDMESKLIQLTYRTVQSVNPENQKKEPQSVPLRGLQDVSPRSRRLQTLARKALRPGMQLVIEVRDLTPVKTIAIHPTA